MGLCDMLNEKEYKGILLDIGIKIGYYRRRAGMTQAELAEILHADKAAIARRTKNLETKGYLNRRDDPRKASGLF